ncbi:MAG: hypothetical protein HDR01_05615 [Lachnospiraceae bacterium]|nr:hypothetical protein [Lachnospiraceae bacterium]
MENRDNVNEKEEKEVFVLELLSEIKRQSKRWMIAFFVVLALWAATIAGFVLFLNQYEFESYTQDGEGQNYINRDVGGDVYNGAEVPEDEQKER